jgi:hypothetical protein
VPVLDVLLPPVVTGQLPERAEVVDGDLDTVPPARQVEPVPLCMGDDRPEPHAIAVGLEVPPGIGAGLAGIREPRRQHLLQDRRSACRRALHQRIHLVTPLGEHP